MGLLFLDEPTLVGRLHVHRRERRRDFAARDLDDVLGLVLDPERRRTIGRDAEPRVGAQHLVVHPYVIDVAVRLRVVRIDRERLFPDQQRTIEVACTVAVQALLDQAIDVGRRCHRVSLPAGLRDHAAEHVQRAIEGLGGIGKRRKVLRSDRLARALDDGARLLDRVLPEVGAGDDVRDLREQPLDLLERLLGLLARLLELLAAADLDHVVLRSLDHLA